METRNNNEKRAWTKTFFPERRWLGECSILASKLTTYFPLINFIYYYWVITNIYQEIGQEVCYFRVNVKLEAAIQIPMVWSNWILDGRSCYLPLAHTDSLLGLVEERLPKANKPLVPTVSSNTLDTPGLQFCRGHFTHQHTSVIRNSVDYVQPINPLE